MTPRHRAWVALLTATTATVLRPPGPDHLALAQEAVRVAWTTARSVRASEHLGGSLHWIRLTETTVALARALDRMAGVPGTCLGSGPAPDGWLPDTPGLRSAVRDLLDGVTAFVSTSAADTGRGAR